MMDLHKKRDYSDIIHLPHPVSKKHPHMSNIDRAAQFSPFAALTGFEEAVCETARITQDRVVLDDDRLERLDRRIAEIEWELKQEAYKKGASREVTIFVPDERKEGGRYVTKRVVIARIDRQQRVLVCSDKTIISIDEIYEISKE